MASNDLASVMLQSGGNLDVALVFGADGPTWHAADRQGSPTRWDGFIIKRALIIRPSIRCKEALRLAQEAMHPERS